MIELLAKYFNQLVEKVSTNENGEQIFAF